MAVATASAPTVESTAPLVPILDPDTGMPAIVERPAHEVDGVLIPAKPRLAVCARSGGAWFLAREVVKYEAGDDGKRSADNGVESTSWKQTGALTDIRDGVEYDLLNPAA